MPRCAVQPLLALVLALLCLSACATRTTIAQAPTATLVPAATATATPFPTDSVVAQTPFACPETTVGSRKIFFDAETGLRFSFPAAWTEHDCVRMAGQGGGQTLLIGSLFFVGVEPRNGLTIQQWVNQQADPQNEQITLTPLTVAHAVDAVTVHVAATPNADPNKPIAMEPLVQTKAIVAGSQYFYWVNPLIALYSMTDTAPPMSHDQLTQQVVTTFDVP